MRDPNRLDSFYEKLHEVHKKAFPDWRFGQLMSNFLGWVVVEKKVDIFFPEDEKWKSWIVEYANQNSMWRRDFEEE